MMRLTWKRAPASMLSYQPQGRCTWRCSVVLGAPVAGRGASTRRLTSWLRARSATSTASAVSTTTTLSSRRTPTSRLVACTSVLRLSLEHHVADAGVAGRVLARSPARRRPRRRGRTSRRRAAPCGCRSRPRARSPAPSPRSRSTRAGRRRTRPRPGGRSSRRPWRASQAVARRGGDVGAEALERGQPDRGAQHEHAAVPVVAAVGEIALGGGEVGLLDEARRPARQPRSPAARGRM